MWHIGSYGVFQVKALPEAVELVLRYNNRMGAKHLNHLVGTFRCSSAGWKIHAQVFEPGHQEDFLHSLAGACVGYFKSCERGKELNNPRKTREVFVDISDAVDVEMVFVKALKDQPKRVLMVIPQRKEHKSFDIHSEIHVHFIFVSDDADAFLLEMTLLDFARDLHKVAHG